MAVQISRYLGASQVIAVGRNAEKLAALTGLGATEAMTLTDPRLGALAHEVDVVLDFLWGETAIQVMGAVLKQRADRSKELSWIHIGSMAGESANTPGAFLRSANLQLLGSGLGSFSDREALVELPALAAEIARGTFRLDVKGVPLSQVAQVWSQPDPQGARIVFTP